MENLSVHPIIAACKSGNELNFRSFYAFFTTFEKLNVYREFITVSGFQMGIFIFSYVIQMRTTKGMKSIQLQQPTAVGSSRDVLPALRKSFGLLAFPT
jgi:hypothetical protein